MRLLRQPGFLLSVLVLLVVAVAIAAPSLLATHDPYLSVPKERLLPPSAEHLFGTDNLGRDLYSRVVHGAALSIVSAALAVAVGVVVGGLVGLASGFLGGVVDFAVMRVVDVLVAIPGILLALIVVATLGFGPVSIGLGVGLGAAGSFARVMRAQVLRVRNEEYVEAARTLGARLPAVVFQHVLPNAARPVIAVAALELGTAILGVSALTFLGFGAPPPAPEWGALSSTGRDFIATQPWLSIIPGLVILAVVLAVNRIARAIGDER
ncbi:MULTISPECIES: ABC transporter permease [Microbacterium]|uniref:ABC transporter permease n=1 Tax=Microbacterium resistens TaxID=156977 RepID=A0ABY3RNH0_9MICO|nr:ABC transporter permease [Microbacterium resistens]MBW1638340.1 ABC transporter permease [Microbacterium resistens]MDA4894593.1 ABC transporter permease [Streptomyces sp. MS2A]UGS25468.1 ABC transporter permease [Microbacterium resistens]